MADKTAITPTREEDYPEWYQQVIKAADLAENSPVRGCMVIKPWGYGIWENMQKVLDEKFKETGHVNAYFPLLIPLSFLEKEAAHVEGFAKECAVVTHHRLTPDGQGGLSPSSPLEEPLIIRPTSETIIGASYAKWVQSYRDLPILINQWANVMRWEMRTRMFLRTSEFLWQEGHTVHATKDEAIDETLKMLDVYESFCKDFMAMPVIKGEKTVGERFPGACNTYSVEAMMQDRKALQSGTSHFLGENFAKASGIEYLDRQGEKRFAFTTSWGVSTRLIGGLIMTHSDDDGLVLPPRLTPVHVVILPIIKKDADRSKVLEYCETLGRELADQSFGSERVKVSIDQRDLRGGEKQWQHIKKGVPIRVEVGPRDMEKGCVFVARRDQSPKAKQSIARETFVETIAETLTEIQNGLREKAQNHLELHTKTIGSFSDFKDFFKSKDGKGQEIHGGFAMAHFHDCEEATAKLKPLKVTPRCIPLTGEREGGTCIFTGKPSGQRVVFAKAY
jgi:prolyl-tRNA synthetase